ncbi:MAG: hypothetical protein IKO42_02805 [Opitutales bacterium]|nr:hypothetical protein [Opitutales bacterium]
MPRNDRQIIHNELLTIAQLKSELLESWNLPYSVLVMGPAGVGKSSAFKQVLAEIATGNPYAEFRYNAKSGCYLVGGEISDGTPEGDQKELETSYGFIDLRLSQVEPQDLAGIPMPENGITIRHLPREIPVCTATHLPKRGLLLLDEVNQADPAVQKAMFSIILDHKIDNKPFLEGWRVMAAGNRLEDSSAVMELAGPLQNRFAHYAVGADYETFKAWAIKNDIHPAITTYLANNATDLCRRQGDNEEYAFPTPRTWEQVSHKIRYWEKNKIKKTSDEKIRGIAALVGSAAAAKFVAHLEIANSFDVEDYLSGKVKKSFTQTEIAEAWGLLSALYSYVLNKKTKEAYIKVYKFAAQSDTFARLKEFMACLAKDLQQYDEKLAKAALMSFQQKELEEFFKKIGSAIL